MSGLTHGTPASRGSTLKSLLKPHQECPAEARSGLFEWKPTKGLLKDAAALEPASTTAIRIASVGRLAVAGGAAVGLGTLYYYGMGMSDGIGAVDKAASWPRYVKDRLRSTYVYFAGSVGLTALSAAAVSRSSALTGLMTRSPWAAFGASCAAIVGAIKLVRSISYEDSTKSKQARGLDGPRGRDGNRPRTSNPRGRTADDEGCLVHGRRCGGPFYGGHVCPQ